MKAYRTWEDLLSDGDKPTAQHDQAKLVSATSPETVSASAADLNNAFGVAARSESDAGNCKTPSSDNGGLKQQLFSRLPDGTSLPADVLTLIDEYEIAEKRLRQLTGQQAAEPEDPRDAARFPIKKHTAASRLQEKRQNVLDEQLSIARKRQRESSAIEMRLEQHRAAIRAALLDARRHAANQLRKQVDQQRERNARRALVKLMHERAAEQWDLNRKRALLLTQLKRREHAVHQEKHLDHTRAQLLERTRASRNEALRDERRNHRALALRKERMNYG